MDIICIPGLWLDGSTFDAVTPTLTAAGHRVRALTLPGMESRDADRSEVRLADQVQAVVDAVDEAWATEQSPVLLVGHSLGAGIGHMGVDARPDRVARGVWVGGFPGVDGQPMLPGLPAANGEVPMPDWVEMGEEANISDFDADRLTRFYAAAIPAPEHVLTDPVILRDERRLDVPVTAVCPEYTAADLQAWLADGEPSLAELGRIRDVEYVDLPGGHWPQLTQPDRLAAVVLAAADRSRAG